MSPAEPLAPGSVRLLDRHAPQLKPGEYEILVEQELPGVAPKVEAEQRFVLSAPQVSLDPSEVVQTFPPQGLAGQYGETLPFVLLAEPMLPWERQMADAEMPWLALLVLGPEELLEAGASPSGATAATVAEFLSLPKTLVPPLSLAPGVSQGQPCSYVKLSTDVFTKVVPRAEELRYLAHVRESGAGSGETNSVLLANRFPAVNRSPAPGAEGPVKSVAHLVSLEAMEPYLVEAPVFTRSGKDDGGEAFDSVALLSLASWSFQSLPDPAQSFAGLALDLLGSEYDAEGDQHHPERLWLRLPGPDPVGGSAAKTVTERRRAGFVPLEYRFRTGETTFAWYRGPLAPELPAELEKPAPFLSADAALAYDPASGAFDASLAAAWQVGRSLALADRGFGTALLELRRKLHRLCDQLYDRLQRDEFATPAKIAELAKEGQLTGSLLSILDADLVAGLRDGPRSRSAPALDRAPDAPTDVREFLAEAPVQASLLELVADDLVPVSGWLARLLRLEQVPFAHLVSDPRMLPAESPAAAGGESLTGSVRFFYVDPNWTGALLDGALSIGLESSLQTFFHKMTAGLLGKAATAAGQSPRCGMLLRSPLVSGWPALQVSALDAGGKALKVLRQDTLAPGVMIALFDAIPATVSLAEPQAGIRLGLDPQGKLELRQPGPAGKPGAALGQTLPVCDFEGKAKLLMRAAGSRVLNLAPTSSEGLVQKLVAALEAAEQDVSLAGFGPAALALQLIDAPQELAFESAGE